ncbi:MAG TPA: SDR family oxidoreductase [Streptosporangiaceae bacterium]
MILKGKNAVVYGAAGMMGGAVARAFGAEGARVFLAGRSQESLERVAAEIAANGGAAETAIVDALDQRSVEAHAEQVVQSAGSLDISFNAISINAEQNVPLTDMPLDAFLRPVDEACRTHFITATAAARRMTVQGSGVIIMLSASSAVETRHQMGGFSPACASIEALTRGLAGEVGRQGVRVVGLRCNFTPETMPGVTDSDVAQLVRDTILGRLPRLAEVAATAVYLASDAAGAMSGTYVNLTCGAVQ